MIAGIVVRAREVPQGDERSAWKGRRHRGRGCLVDKLALALHFCSALLLILLAFLVLVKGRRDGSVSLAVGLVTIALLQVVELFARHESSDFLVYRRLTVFLESVAPVCLLLYGDSYRRRSEAGSSRLPLLLLALIGTGFVLCALVAPLERFFSPEESLGRGMIALGELGYWFYLGLMIYCVAALVNIESVFTAMHGADRWRVKYELLGVGVILGGGIFYFSQGLLYKSVNMTLLPVRSGMLMVAGLLVGYSRLFRGQKHKVVVSRYVFYRSFTLLAVGIYLLGLGLTGQFLRSFQISLGRDLLLLAVFVSGVAFLALVFSEEIRRRVKVLVTKHFYAQKHDYREQWLGFSNALAASHRIDEVQEAIIEAYLRIFGVRFAALYVRAGGGASFSLAALQGHEVPLKNIVLSQGLVGYFAETGRVLNPRDGEYTPTAEEAGLFADSEAWLLVPMMAGNHVEAVALLGTQIAPEKLTYEDYDLMKLIGRQAVLSLKNFRLSEELAEARELAAVAKVSSFVIHDLKNLAYTFSLMMDNGEEHIAEPDFQKDLIMSIRSTVAKMNTLIAKLKAFPQKQELRTEAFDLALLARETLDDVRRLKPAVSFLDECAPAVALVDVQEMKKVVLNLLINAGDALGEKGRIVLSTASRDGEVFLRVQDNGCGMSKTFVENHLFRPFRTTKEKGLGIGLYQCKQIIESHGGRIEVASREGEGTTVTVIMKEQCSRGKGP